MRILVYLTVGVAAGCGVSAYGMGKAWFFPVLAVLSGIFILGIVFGKQKKIRYPALLVLIGWLLGLGWFWTYQKLAVMPLTVLQGQEQTMTVTVSDYPKKSAYGYSVDGHVMVDGRKYGVRVWLKKDCSLAPGDSFSSTFRIRSTGAQEKDSDEYYLSQRIHLLLTQRDEAQIQRAGKTPAECLPSVLRQKLLSILDSLFEGDMASFAKALLQGETSGLGYRLDTAFRLSGIRHIVAVSGLHICVLYGILRCITFRNRYLSAVVSIPVLLLFAAVAGFTPSVTRACFMVLLMILAGVFNREYDSSTALAVSVLLMVARNPWVVASVSLQLSVSCVAGIILFQGRLLRWLKQAIPGGKGFGRKLHGGICSSLAVSISAMSLVTPLSALYFGSVCLAGVLTNLLALWLVNLVFNGLVVICIAWWFIPSFAAWTAGILVWPIRLVLWIAQTIADFPLSCVYTCSPYIVIWLVLVYVLLGVFLLRKDWHPMILICCSSIGLCIALAVSWIEPMLDSVRITMLDVGQGQSILLQSEGRAFLVDCGSNDGEETADLVAETLLSQGIFYLDGIILTHFDSDHSSGLEYLLTRMETDLLFLPSVISDYVVPETTGQVLWVKENLSVSFGSSEITIFGPIYNKDNNENSLCVLFDTEKCDILITGDRGSFGEQMLCRYMLPDVDVLVAGHHGSADAACEELLQTVKPETVLISVGKDNVYGHPAQSLLKRLEDYGCTVYRTDINGTITIRR